MLEAKPSFLVSFNSSPTLFKKVKNMRLFVWIMLFVLQTELTNTFTSSDDSITFTVRQDNILVSNISTTVPFPKILTNAGNALLNFGVFNCTRPGLYTFHVHAMSDKDKTTYLDLYLDDQVVVTLRDVYLGDSSVSGNTAILRLEEGNTVQVKTRDQVNVYVGVGKTPEYYTLFTGVQISSSDGTNDTEALFVALDQDFTIAENKPIEYRRVVVDTANGYDLANSLYKVQSDGIFIVTFYTLIDRNKFEQALFYNNKKVVASWNLLSSQNGNTVILDLKTNDSLTVRGLSGVGSLQGSPTEIYSTLTVLKLFDGEPFSNSSFVAFSVGIDGTPTLNNQKFVFDTIYYNLNGVYGNVTGNSLAPVNGFYQFNIHAMTNVLGQNNFFLTLCHNEKKISSTLAKYVYHTYSASTQVLRVYANDTVYINATGYDEVWGYGTLTTFSGQLLQTF